MEILTAVALAAALAAGGPAPATAEDVARRVEDGTLRAADLKARFVQTYRSPLLGREIVERGTMSLKRPGRMRWDYEDPEKKLFLCDGKTFYFYVPADHQVVVRDQADARGVAGLLLSGRGELLAQFSASLETAPEGRLRLRLTPRKADPDVERVYLDLDAGYRIRVIEVLDAQGSRSRFEFDDMRENVGLPDRLFRFEVPKGVEVVSG